VSRREADQPARDPSVSSAAMTPAAPVRHPARGPVWVVVAAALLLCVPMVVALVQMRQPTWRPVLDLAMTELRVRDVGGSDTPLIGLPGRIGNSLEEQGSHPGPLSFYALAPTYRLLGSSAWAMQVGTVVIHLVALLVALALARRRGGLVLVAGVTAGVAVLSLGYGTSALVEPWNPYLPLLWWLTLLLAVWSVLCDDLVGLPVAVGAASMCAQTHVPYLALALGLGALAVGALAIRVWRAQPGSPTRRQAVRWGGGALALGVVLWLPPTIDEVVNEPGNYTKLIDHFTTPPEPETPIGLRVGADETLQRLDLWHLLAHQVTEPGLLTEGSAERFPSPWRGLALLVAWAAAAVWSLRSGDRRLRALHAVSGVAFLLGLVSISRIFGLTWYYLMLWMWAVGGLMAAAVLWTLHGWWRQGPRRPRVDLQVVTGVFAAVAVLVTVRTAVDAVDAVHTDGQLSVVLHELVGPTVEALEAGEGAATGRDGRYLVAWSDSLHIGSQAYGLMSELERAGFDAGLLPLFHVPATDHRSFGPEDATARVELVTGRFLDEWRRRDDAVEVAHVDARSDADVARFEELRQEIVTELEAEGLDELFDSVEGNLFGVGVDPRVPDVTRRKVDEMLHIGLPTSVFVAPPTFP
jgi:hypothetical protein